MITLNEMLSGQEGVVMEVGGCSSTACRLRELGLISGAWIRVLRGGHNCVCQVGESRFCLRGAEVCGVQVLPLPMA